MSLDPEIDARTYYPEPFERRYEHSTALPIAWGTLHANASAPARRGIRLFLLASSLLPALLITAYLVGAFVSR
ncbi:MAG: hypothetical protein ACKV2O_10080 [Acidimicrobiales bacterium]